MIQNTISFAFFGTPDVAVETLDILKAHGYIPNIIVTSPDRPAGRGLALTPPPVKIWAETHHIPYLQPEKLDSEFLSKLQATSYKLFIVVAYGKIIPQNIIDLPEKGTFNIHYSLLPKYRGASPVESAILHGEIETGVDIQRMAFELDSGDIIAEEKVSIEPDEVAPVLRKRLIQIGGKLLVDTLPSIINGAATQTKQTKEGVSKCGKIKKENGLIDLADDPIKNYNKYRAYFGWPGVHFFKNDKRIKITKAKFENGQFIPERIIPEGKKETDYRSLN